MLRCRYFSKKKCPKKQPVIPKAAYLNTLNTLNALIICRVNDLSSQLLAQSIALLLYAKSRYISRYRKGLNQYFPM